MSTPQPPSKQNPHFGLCADCQHARIIESAAGSHFLLCQLSHSDPSFPKYPRLPILACAGYFPKPAA